jgi:O-antigen/teichoic acid export membrane protein
MVFDTKSGIRWLSILQFSEIFIQSMVKIILAWILSPSAFGVVGSALILTGFVQATSQTGVYAALIQRKNKTEDYLDTGWSIEIVRGLALYAIIYYVSPWYIEYMVGVNQQDYIDVIRVLALTIIIDSFKNVGIVLFDKQINFRQVFNLQISGLIVRTIATLAFSLYFQTYWGLIYGMILGSLTVFIMSYVLSDYRPKFNFELTKCKQLLNFGIWVFAYTIVGYLILKLSDAFVLKYIGIEGLGIFQMAFFIGMLFRNSISEIQNRIIFPLASKYQSNEKEIKKLYIESIELSVLLYLPAGVGLVIVSDNLVSIMFDESWAAIADILPLLSIAGIFSALVRVIEQFYKGVGSPKYVFSFSFISVLILLFCIMFVYERTLLGISYSILTSSIMQFSIIFIHSLTFFKARDELPVKNISVIVIGVVLMATSVTYFNQYFSTHDAVQLLWSIVTGVVIYASYLYIVAGVFNMSLVKKIFSYMGIYSTLKRRNSN